MKTANIPNIITSFRILLVVPILVTLLREQYHLAFYLCALAGFSDAVDGFLARRYSWTSRFGSIADPIADKLLLMSCFVSLAYLDKIPMWLLVAVLGRDIIIIGGATLLHFMLGPYDFAPSYISKANTFFQIIFLSLVIYNLAFGDLSQQLITIIMITVFVTTVASLVDYIWVWGRRAFLKTK